MLIDSKEVINLLLEKKYFYLNQGRYTQAVSFREAIDVVNSLERSADENKGRVFTNLTKRQHGSIS